MSNHLRTSSKISNATFSSYPRSPPRTQPSIIIVSATPISSRATSSCRQTLDSWKSWACSIGNTSWPYPCFSSLVYQVVSRTTMTRSRRLSSHSHWRRTWTSWTKRSTTTASSTCTTSKTRRNTSWWVVGPHVHVYLPPFWYHWHAPKTTLIQATEIWRRLLGGRCAVSSCVRTRWTTQDEGAERKATSSRREF